MGFVLRIWRILLHNKSDDLWHTISGPSLWYLDSISHFHLTGICPPDSLLIFRKIGKMIQASSADVEEQLQKQYMGQAEHLPGCQRAVADPNFHCSKIHRRNRAMFFSNLSKIWGLKSLSEIVNSG